MSFLSSLNISASALTAERYRMDVITQNIANEKTTMTEDGTPYRRKQVIFEERPLSFSEELDRVQGGVQIQEVIESDREFQRIYDPSNPQADEEGYVLSSNVDTTEEMVDMLAASNAYEANLTAFNVVKATISKTLELSR